MSAATSLHYRLRPKIEILQFSTVALKFFIAKKIEFMWNSNQFENIMLILINSESDNEKESVAKVCWERCVKPVEEDESIWLSRIVEQFIEVYYAQ